MGEVTLGVVGLDRLLDCGRDDELCLLLFRFIDSGNLGGGRRSRERKNSNDLNLGSEFVVMS